MEKIAYISNQHYITLLNDKKYTSTSSYREYLSTSIFAFSGAKNRACPQQQNVSCPNRYIFKIL